MKLFTTLIGLLAIVWRAECAPKIPKAPAIAAPAAFVAASVAPEWYCETICAGGCGGRPFYDTHKQVCRCSINEHIDDGDMELIKKTARIVNMKIKFYEATKVMSKRSLDESESFEEKNEEAEEPSHENTDKQVKPPKKFTFPSLKTPALKPLFPDLAARFHKPQEETPPEDAILGQIDPTIDDTEPHHNIYTGPQPGKKSLFGGPILGQINPSIKETEPHHNIHAGYPTMPGGFGLPFPAAHGFPTHLTPALTRSMLMNVREKLDNLMLRTQQYPYQPAVTAHETESMRNTLKQITQVNVNVRPVGTTFGYFFNNLVNQLAPMLRAEAPNATPSVDVIEGATPVSTEVDRKETKQKSHKKSKVPIELGKKTSTKGTTTKIVITPSAEEDEISSEETTLSTKLKPSTIYVPVKPIELSTVKVLPEKEQEPKELPTLLPIEQIFTLPTIPAFESTTAKFLPVQEGDDLVGNAEDYLYDDHHELD